MQEQLKNIFVTKEVAKLAKEKGFNEVCVGYFEPDESDVSPNCGYSLKFILNPCDNQDKYIEAPTHYQLIEWLLREHAIHIGYGVGDYYAQHFHIWRSMSFQTIDEVLIFALNQINQNQHGK